MIKISFVIPIFNEEESLLELVLGIEKTLKEDFKKYSWEVIFVNDGSTDKSFETLKKLRTKHHQIKIISFRRNLGKALALTEGFKKSSGDLVVTMDGDLQDSPKNLSKMVDKISQGFDLVVGWKENRQDPWDKTLPSRCFNFIVRTFSKVPLHDFNSGLKVMRAEVASEIKIYGAMHRFIPVLAARRGFRVTEIPVVHLPRKYGHSKYGWQRFFSGLFDFITVMFLGSFGHRPFHLFGFLGVLSLLIGTICEFYLTVLHFQGVQIYRRPLLIIGAIFILTGFQMLSIGLTAEMLLNRTDNKEGLPIEYETP